MSDIDAKFPFKFTIPYKDVVYMGKTLRIMRLPERNVGVIMMEATNLESAPIAYVDNWDGNGEFNFLQDEGVRNMFKIQLGYNSDLVENELYQAIMLPKDSGK